MYKYLIFTAIAFCSTIHSYTQENINLIEILNIKEDMRSLEKRISKLIKKNPDIVKTKDLKQFYILPLGIKDVTKLTKEDYLNHSFLYHLYHFHANTSDSYAYNFDTRIKCVRSHTLITDSKGNLVAHGDVFSIAPTSSIYDSHDAMWAKMFFDKEIEFAFRIVSPGCRYTFGVKGNNLYAFGWEKTVFDEVFVEWDFVKYTWEKFIECCLDDCINSKSNK